MIKLKLELTQEQLNTLIFVLGNNIDVCKSIKHIEDPLGKDIENKEKLLEYLVSKKPIELTENTKQFLELINKDYKYIARTRTGKIGFFTKYNPKYEIDDSSFTTENIEQAFDIDLSFIKPFTEYLISDLLGGEE